MEKPLVNPVNKVELPKAEQSVEHFSLSKEEKNIQEVFKIIPELESIAFQSIKSGETIALYRIENKNIEKEPDGITSHKDLKGQWFSPDLETALVYLRKSQQTFGTDVKPVEGANLVVVKISKEEFKNLHVSKHPIASQMDVENDNYIIPENIERNYINLDDVQDKVGNFENFQKAKEQVKEKVKSFEQKEAIELYQEYLKTIFPESKLQEIVYHGTNRKFDKFERKHGLDDLSGIEGVDDYYFTDNIKLAKFFAEKYKKVLYAIQKSYESGNVDWYFKRQENAGDLSEFQESTKELWDNIYNEWQSILEESHNGKKLDDILKEPNIKYFENKQGFGFRFGKMLLPYYLMSDYESYKTYPDGNIVPAVLDLKKPYIKEGDRNSMDGILSEAGYKHKKEDNEIDGGIQHDTDEKNIVVFKPEQIHILGSKSDIEKFKEFVSKNENKNDKQSIEEFLKEQGIEKVPHIETNFLFHQHATTEDGKKVADKLDGTDILIQENAGWDEERLKTWQKVSQGEFTPEQAIEHEKQRGKEFFWKDYFTAIFEKLHGSNKEVLLVDLKNDDELYQEIYEFMKGNSAYNDLVNRESSYEEMLERISNVSELESLMQKERENKILENIKTNLSKLLKEKPELQNKENLKILFPMGAFHTHLYHEMKKQGDDVKREFSPANYIFDPRQSVERKIHFKGIEEAQGDMPKILLYWLLRKIDIPHNFISHQRIDLFSSNQIREFFDIYKKSESDETFKSEGQKYFNSIVQVSKSKN